MFRRALIRLTLQYSLVLLALFALFSAGIYQYMDATFGGDYGQPSHSVITEGGTKAEGAAEAADAGLERLIDILLTAGGIMLLLVPLISYALARRALRPVEESFAAQQRFVDDASHELRGPLSVLQGELELALSKPRAASEYRAAIATALEGAGRVSDLTQSLLLLARGSRQQQLRSFEAIALDRQATEAAQAIRQRYGKKARIKLDLDHCRIGGVPSLVGQTLANVLDNAVKYSPGRAEVRVRIRQHNGWARVEISDRGIGISDQEAAQARERFWRADASRSVKGFGLGLSLVDEIMRLHGGSLTIDSKPGAGTVVRLDFPNALPR